MAHAGNERILSASCAGKKERMNAVRKSARRRNLRLLLLFPVPYSLLFYFTSTPEAT